jgi:hypothetical protein
MILIIYYCYECKDNHFIPYKEENPMIFSISYTITAKKEEVAVLIKQQPPNLF